MRKTSNTLRISELAMAQSDTQDPYRSDIGPNFRICHGNEQL